MEDSVTFPPAALVSRGWPAATKSASVASVKADPDGPPRLGSLGAACRGIGEPAAAATSQRAPPGQARRSMARKQSNQSGPPGRGRLIRQASKQFNHLGLGPGGRQKRSSANAPSPR